MPPTQKRLPTVGTDGKLLSEFIPATVETVTGAQAKATAAQAAAVAVSANLTLSNVNAATARTSLGLGDVATLTLAQLRALLSAPPLTHTLTRTPMGSTAVFTSAPFAKGAYAAARLTVSSDAEYTAVMQTSLDGTDWANTVTYTVTAGGSLFTVDQTVSPPLPFMRWVITATAINMTSMLAKVVLT